MKKTQMRKLIKVLELRILGYEKETASFSERQHELEEENQILKAKLAFCHDNWPGFLPLEDALKETREEYRNRVIKDTGIKTPDLSHMKFLEDYLPQTHEDDAKACITWDMVGGRPVIGKANAGIKPGWGPFPNATEDLSEADKETLRDVFEAFRENPRQNYSLDTGIKPGWADRARSAERKVVQEIKNQNLQGITEETLLERWDELKGNG